MHYTIPTEIVDRARMLGLADGENEEVLQEIASLVRLSAPITHPLGNKRNEDWLFKVHKGLVQRVHLIKCETCDDRKWVQAYDVCDDCGGVGCDDCYGRGEKMRRIPCPVCT